MAVVTVGTVVTGVTQKKKIHQKKCFQRKLFFFTKKNFFHTKHRENCKMLPLEHHISCQMCRIALSKSTEKKKEYIYIYNSDSSERNHATSPQKIMQPLFFLTVSLLESAI